LELVPAVARRPGALQGPHPPGHRLEPQPSFVLAPTLDLLARVVATQRGQPLAGPVKATPAVARGWPPSGDEGAAPPAGTRGPSATATWSGARPRPRTDPGRRPPPWGRSRARRRAVRPGVPRTTRPAGRASAWGRPRCPAARRGGRRGR